MVSGDISFPIGHTSQTVRQLTFENSKLRNHKAALHNIIITNEEPIGTN
jgi:hypothetical protein